MTTRYKDITGVVLAGGRSRRMGADKRFLTLGDETLFGRVLNALDSVFATVMVSVAEETHELPVRGHRMVPDMVQGCATMGGLYSSLMAMQTEWLFAAACDMPLVDPRVIRYLVEQREDYDFVLPILLTGPQPMHACYRRSCADTFERCIKRGEFQLQGALRDPALRGCLVSEDQLVRWDGRLLSFMNVNTPSDLECMRKLMGLEA